MRQVFTSPRLANVEAVAQLLEDESMQVRLQAARVLPEFDREKAFLDLMKLTKDRTWERREPSEREAIYAAIGATSMPGAIAYFTQVLAQKAGLFDRKKVLEDKLLAIAGLGGACNIQTAKLLQELAEDRQQPEEVMKAAKVQLARVRKVLFGENHHG